MVRGANSVNTAVRVMDLLRGKTESKNSTDAILTTIARRARTARHGHDPACAGRPGPADGEKHGETPGNHFQHSFRG
jgi:hypothetical protein